MRKINRKSAVVISLAAGTLSLASSAFATDGTWSNFVSGSWSDTSKWINGTIPDGAGSTASLVVVNGNNTGATLTLDSNRTIQNLVFGNLFNFLSGSNVGTINVNSANGATLNFASSGSATPTIVVPSYGTQGSDPGVKTATIVASLAGSQGINVKFGSYAGDTFQYQDPSNPGQIDSAQYTSNHYQGVTIAGSNSFTGGVMYADGVGSLNISNTNALNGLTGLTFANSAGSFGSNANNLYLIGANFNIGTLQTLTLSGGTLTPPNSLAGADRRILFSNQSGNKQTWEGNVVLTGDSTIQIQELGTSGQITIAGNVDGTALSNYYGSLLLRGTNTSANTFGQINGDMTFNTSTGVIGKTDPGLWMLNTADTSGINAYRLQISAGTLRVVHQSALSPNVAIVLGQRNGTSDSAIYETNGNLTDTLGSGGGQISSPFPMGLSAGGGALNVDLDGGASLQFAAYNGSDTSYANVTGTAAVASAGAGVISLGSVDPASIGVSVGDYVFLNSAATAAPFKITGIDDKAPDSVDVDLSISTALNGSARFFSASKLNDTTMFLNSLYATNNLTFQNGLDFNGKDRSMVVYSQKATLSGNITNSSLTSPAGLIKLNIGTLGTGTLELTGSNSFNNGTAVRIGVLQVGNDYALGTGTLNVTAQNAGATGTATQAFAGSVQLESSLNNTAVVAGGITMSQLATDTTGAAHTATLAPSLDLGGSNMVLNYTGSSPIATIQSYLHSGWLKTSATGEVVGYGEATTLYPSGGSFYNVALDGVTPALLLKTTFAGDANLDGTVNALDFNALATNFGGSALSGQFWTAGDFNNDGTVDSNDFALLAANYGKVLPAPSEPAAALGALVPEPIGISLLGMVGVLGLRRRVHSR